MSEQWKNPTRDPILDSITDGVFTVDMEWRVTSFNRAAEQITGVRAPGHRPALLRRVPRQHLRRPCALRHTLDTGTPVVNKTVYIVDAKGQRIPISISTAHSQGRLAAGIIGGVETFRDLSLVEELRKEAAGQLQFCGHHRPQPGDAPVVRHAAAGCRRARARC